MSLTVRRPKHGYIPPAVPTDAERADRAEAEARRLSAELRRCDADRLKWRQRAASAEHTLTVLPSALANPDNLIRRLVAERDLERQACRELRAQLQQHQARTEPDPT